ncbi:MAG: hypothetical protein ACFB50_11880 [Rubrobacteraceae bacterium]
MSKKNGLGKLYDQFKPEERFRLVIEAQARGDEEDVRRLVRTCPRHNYLMTEAEYTDRMIVAETLVQAVALDLAPRIAKAKMIEGFEEALPLTYNSCANEASLAYFDGHERGIRWAWEKAGASLDGDPPKPEDEDYDDTELDQIEARIHGASERFTKMLEKLKLGVATEARAIWEAFSVFCREELDLEPEKPVRVFFEPLLSEVENLLKMTEGVEVEQERIDDYREVIRSGWQKSLETL